MEANEQWRAIRDFEGYYEVSDLGRVRSVTRIVIRADGVRQQLNSRIIKGSLTRTGYPKVILQRDGKSKTRTTHLIVAEAFIPECVPSLLRPVDHMDRNPLNAALTNLRWTTQRVNMLNQDQKPAKHGRNKYRGVFFDKRYSRPWTAHMGVGVILGRFATEQEAKACRDAAYAKEMAS